MNKTFLKIILGSSVVIGTVVGVFFIFYLFLLPCIVASDFAVNNVQKLVNKYTDLSLTLEKPELKTSIKPEISLKVPEMELKKDNLELVKLENFNFVIGFEDIFKKKIRLDELSAKTLFLDANNLIDAFPQGEEQVQPMEFDWVVDFYNAKLGVKNSHISYKYSPDTVINIDVNGANIENVQDASLVHFDSMTDILKNGKSVLKVKVDDKNKVRIQENSLIVNSLPVVINKSNVDFSMNMDMKDCDINVKSNKFLVADIFELVNSNVFIPNGKELLDPLTNPNGSIAFDINMKNDAMSGNVDLKSSQADLKYLSNMPLKMQKGKINITPEKLNFIGLDGFYGKNSAENKIKIDGVVKDYYQTFDSDITIDTVATNEFLSKYLAPLLGGTTIIINENIPTRLIYKAVNNKMDITWLTKIAKGVSFGVDDSPSPLVEYDRAVKGDFHIEGNDLDIRNINYYIAKDIYKGMGKITPILVFDGKMNIATGMIDEIGFKFGREMPSEFMNIFVRQKFFKGGTIDGDLHAKFVNNIPKLDANMQLKKVRIPSQRLRISEAILSTDNKNINLTAKGGFKRIKYDFIGVLKNELVAPFVVRDLELNLDKVDVERLMASLNNQQNPQPQTDEQVEKPVVAQNDNDEDENANDNFMFDTNLVVIEDCAFRLKEGNYKQLNFGNIEAKMTLDKDGIFNLQSNKFDIAEGISTLKIKSDLKNMTHYLRLGVKDVDSDLMSTVILGLSNEISGKAKGLIELTTDSSMSLNGEIKFAVENGTIGKIGVVEYLMKVASIFRNPLVMISPSTIADLVNMPEGNFDRIYGEMKLQDNVIKNMKIQSSSPTLSALIKGRYDLAKQDASLRIYTRFTGRHKGALGFLRNISLNALANKVKMSGRNDANYYSSELAELPEIDAKDSDTQVFLTQVEGDVEHNNFLSSLKKIK